MRRETGMGRSPPETKPHPKGLGADVVLTQDPWVKEVRTVGLLSRFPLQTDAP